MNQQLRNRSAALILGVVCAPVSAAPYGSAYDQAAGYGVETLENRVEKLEKKLSGQALPKMLTDMEKLQSEVGKLRGQLEKAENELERLKRQQKEELANMDQRLQQVITNQSVIQTQMQSAVPPVAPAAPTDGSAPTLEPSSPDAAGPIPATGAGTPAPEPPAPVPPREVAYQKAFATLKEGKYSEAIQAFKGFMAAYPSGEFSDNAQYWLAEAYYVTRDYGAARNAFEQVTQGFPQSAKVPDAMLKIGFIDFDRGQYTEARSELAELIKRFPNSSAAKLAGKRLDKMQQDAQ